jgi:hypothetical protein
MGFLDRAKQVAEQAQKKLEEVQTEFNERQGERAKEHQQDTPAPPAGQAPPPSGEPAAPPPDEPAAPSPPPPPAAEEERAGQAPDPFKPLDQG